MLDKHRSRMTSSEMKYLRKIKGKTRRDRVRNISIRESLNMETVVEMVERRNLKWYGHMVSIKQNRFLRQEPKKEDEEVDLRKNGSNTSMRLQGKEERRYKQ